MTHHQKRLHLILIPHRHLIDVQDARVAPTLDPAVRLDGFEDRPALRAVPPVAGEAVGEEEGFNRFWAGRRGVVRGFFFLEPVEGCGEGGGERVRKGEGIKRRTEGYTARRRTPLRLVYQGGGEASTRAPYKV